METTSEKAPLQGGGRPLPYLPMETAGRTFGSTFFLISTILAAIIPIIELTLGLYYKGTCPIDERIPTYMIVAGICGLALVGLSILLALTFTCLISDSTVITVLASCGVCLNMVATFVLSIFVFIWFIIGCVWVFRVAHDVQFKNQGLSDYCDPTLYKSAFVLLILTIVWAIVQCCVSCCRRFCWCC